MRNFLRILFSQQGYPFLSIGVPNIFFLNKKWASTFTYLHTFFSCLSTSCTCKHLWVLTQEHTHVHAHTQTLTHSLTHWSAPRVDMTCIQLLTPFLWFDKLCAFYSCSFLISILVLTLRFFSHLGRIQEFFVAELESWVGLLIKQIFFPRASWSLLW